MKKILFLITGFIISLAFIPNVFALTLKEVSDITGNDTKISGESEVTKIDDKTTKITYKNAEFYYASEETNDAGFRPKENAWIGIKVAYPEGVTDDSYDIYVNGELYEDGGVKKESSYSEWFGINLKRLNEAIENNTKITYRIAFDWDKKDDKEDQVVIIEIDPMSISLYKTQDKSEEVWTPAIALEKKAELDKANKQEDQAKKETEKNQNPNTSDINLLATVGTILVSALCVLYIFKKRFN